VGSRSASRQVTIFNAGVRPLHLSSAEVRGAQATDFSVTLGPCAGTVLAAYDSCDIATSFAPSAPGVRSAQLAVSTDDPNGAVVTDLAGVGSGAGPLTGTSRGQAAVSPDRSAPMVKLSVRRRIRSRPKYAGFR
jgi:hypothetical protein